MYNRFPTCALGILSLFVMVSCVTIPSQTQLINGKTQNSENLVSANCSVEKIRQSLNNAQEPDLQLDSTNISLLNWNIYKAQRDNWPEDFKAFIAAQDLVLIQEALNSPQVTSLLDRHHPHWNLNTAFFYDGYETGVLTASKTPSLFSCGLRATEPLIRLPKTVLINLYPLTDSDEKLLVANLHGINFTLGIDAYTEQIRHMVEIIEQHNGPVIVAGDFNTWSNQRMNIVDAMAQQLSLQAVSYSSHDRVKIFDYALDHIFYRGLEAIQEDTLQVSSSDHNPIKVSFRLANQAIALSQK
ncbi:MAG: endonuclease/exonuclease/phosphatase family protein [Gammaproteobacteria bacterium]|nr:endonuclease/exonuclease/phosphatase family protein [Gammaproteobacteria bacterium]